MKRRLKKIVFLMEDGYEIVDTREQFVSRLAGIVYNALIHPQENGADYYIQKYIES